MAKVALSGRPRGHVREVSVDVGRGGEVLEVAEDQAAVAVSG